LAYPTGKQTCGDSFGFACKMRSLRPQENISTRLRVSAEFKIQTNRLTRSPRQRRGRFFLAYPTGKQICGDIFGFACKMRSLRPQENISTRLRRESEANEAWFRILSGRKAKPWGFPDTNGFELLSETEFLKAKLQRKRCFAPFVFTYRHSRMVFKKFAKQLRGIKTQSVCNLPYCYIFDQTQVFYSFKSISNNFLA